MTSEAERLHGHLIGQQGSRRSLNTPALVLDLEMLDRLEIQRGGRAPTAQFDIVVLVAADRHAVQRQVRDAQQQVAQLAVQIIGLGLHPGDVGLLFGHQAAQALEFVLVAAGLGGAGTTIAPARGSAGTWW